MGMCKGCGQIFKTEDMKYNFCIGCQDTNIFKEIDEHEKDKARLLIEIENSKAKAESNKVREEEILKLISEKKDMDRAKKQWNFVKTYYKHLYFSILLLVVLFPPFYSGSNYIRHKFIFAGNSNIAFGTFMSEIIAITVIGLAFYIIFLRGKGKKNDF